MATQKTSRRKKNSSNGQVRQKRGDTHIGTIEKIYGKDFGVRSDANLGKYLKKHGYPSLAKLLADG